MPYGLVPSPMKREHPPREGKAYDGPDAPKQYSRDAFQSGTIRIFARVIEFCDKCVRLTFNGSPVPGGDPFDRERAIFLRVGGLKGGRGGLGTNFPCALNLPPSGPFTFPCDEVVDWNGGLSGAPGQGGDAGNVFVYIVNNPVYAARERQLQAEFTACAPAQCTGVDFAAVYGRSLAALADISGGPPSHMARLRTPSLNRLVSLSERTVFTPEDGTEVPVTALMGRDGSLVVEDIEPEEAIGRVATILTGHDNNPKYDLKAVIEALDGNRTLSSPIAREMLGNLLLQMLVNRQLALIETLPSGLRGQAGHMPQDFLSGLNCGGRRVAGLIDVEFELARRICEFKPYPGEANPLRSYFYRTGGLFRPAEVTSGPNFQAERTIAELQAANKALQDVRQELTILNSHFYEYMNEQRHQRFEDRLAVLNQALEAANAALAVQEDRLAQLFGVGKQAEAGVKAAIAAWSSADYAAFAGSAVQMGQSVVRFFSMLNSADLTAPQREAIKRVEAQITDVEQEFQAFQQESAALKKELLARQMNALADLLRARSNIQAARRTIALDYESLLRGALLLYLSDPYRQEDQLLSSTRAIRDVVANFPNQVLSFLPPRIMVNCQGQPIKPYTALPVDLPVGCALVTAERTTYALVSDSGERLHRFPLLVVAAGSGSYLVSFNWMFSLSGIQKVRTGGAVRGWEILERLP